MKPSILLMKVLLFAVVFSGPACFAEGQVEGGDVGSIAAADLVPELRGRFLLTASDELRASREIVVDGIAILERLIEHITPLESPRREDHFRELLDWHHQLLDLYDNELEFFDDEYGKLTSKSRVSASDWHTHALRIVKRQKMLFKELVEESNTFRAEERAIAVIIQHRRQLQIHFDDLTVRISRLEEKMGNGKKEPPRLPELRHELSVVQGELMTMPVIDEEVLAHYGVLTALAQTADDWLSVKVERWEAVYGFADVYFTTAGKKPRLSLREALEGMIRTDRELIGRLKRKMAQADYKRERLAPSGTLRQMDRNRELDDLYLRLKAYYERELGRLEAAAGGFEADMIKIQPER